MQTHLHLRSAIIMSIVLLWSTILGYTPARATSTAQPMLTDTTTQYPLIPLKRCFAGGPSTSTGTVCCMSGYVILDGKPVVGAKLTITSPHGQMTTWTTRVTASAPFYSLALNTAPLNAQVGETLTITASYSGHTRTQTYQVASGEQQVDLVLPRNQNVDYQFVRQIWSQAGAGEFNTPTGVAVDRAGRVYVVDSSNARVQVFTKASQTPQPTTAGQFLQQWGTLGDEPGQFAQPYGIAVDSFNTVYVTDQGNDRVEKYSLTGDWIGTIGASGSANGLFNNPAGIAVDASGKVYVADRDNNRIQVFNAAGTFLQAWGGLGAANGLFSQPLGIAVGPDSNVYVADSGNQRIQVFTPSGQFLRAWTGSNPPLAQPVGITIDASGNVDVLDGATAQVRIFSSTGAPMTNWGSSGNGTNQLYQPRGIASDSNGNIYIADTGNTRMQWFTATGQPQGTWGVYGCTCGKFNGPYGITFDAAGNVYVVDSSNQRVQAFTATGTFMKQWSHYFLNPKGIATGINGDLYVVDSGNNHIQEFHTDGTFVRNIGQFGTTNGFLRNPSSIAFIPSGAMQGDLYVADTGNNRVQQLHSDGTFVRAWGGTGSNTGQFSNPAAIAVAANGDVYVADTSNHRIQQFTSTGAFIRSWGSYGSSTGQFSSPSAIAIDSSNTVYVTDTYNSRVQAFTSTGTWLATWGGYGGGDGSFIWPQGIAVDAIGNVFVADGNNNRVEVFRRITYTKPTATVVSPVPPIINAGQTVILRGLGGTGTNAPITSYQWMLDNQQISTAATATVSSTLTKGPHILVFRVGDSTGNLSDPQTFSINAPFVSDPSPSVQQRWTFLLYLDGDNTTSIPLADALERLRQHATLLASDVVAVYDGPIVGDTVYYHFKPDGTGGSVTGPRGLTEVDMSDPQTLIDFVTWGKQQAPADYYYLAITDHGNGLDGTAWDQNSTSPTPYLSNTKLLSALRTITTNGQNPIDVLHLDSCLMGLLENAYQLRGMAKYLITSESEAWSVFGYDQYNQALKTNSTPVGLVTAIVDLYAQTVGSAGYSYTLAALDMSQIETFTDRVNTLAGDLTNYARRSTDNQQQLQDIWQHTQRFDSSTDSTITIDDAYVDIGDLVSRLQAPGTNALIQNDSAAVQTALATFVIHEKHASGTSSTSINLSHASGVAIYYPYQPSGQLYQSYIHGDLLFARNTRWTDFLAVTATTYDANPPALNPAAPGRLP